MKKLIYVVILTVLSSSIARAQDQESEDATFRVLGLFMEVRVQALKKEIAKHEGIELVAVNYESGEVTLRLHGPFRLKNSNSQNQLRGLNERVRLKSRGAFELLPPHDKPLSERTKVEISIRGHDCLGCSFGAYRAVYKMEGVHRVTADFGEGRLVAWIDSKVTSRETLEAELVKRRVLLAGKANDD